MRFTRFPRVVPYVVTPRKLAYTRRAIQHARDKCPLFPELTDQRTAERRMADNARHSRLYWQDMRDTQAASWRQARRELRTLRASQRAGVAPVLAGRRAARLPGLPAWLYLRNQTPPDLLLAQAGGTAPLAAHRHGQAAEPLEEVSTHQSMKAHVDDTELFPPPLSRPRPRKACTAEPPRGSATSPSTASTWPFAGQSGTGRWQTVLARAASVK